MKKIILASFLSAAMGFVLVGCLKDKGFENHEYGINDPDTQPIGVGWNYGNKANAVGLDVSPNNQAITGLLILKAFSGTPAPSDINVTVTDNSVALIGAYNAANGTNVQILPSSIWSLSPANGVILQGDYLSEMVLNVSNTTGLDANTTYGLGLTISAVDGNFKIADNLKNLVMIFSVKNQYDGKYTLRGSFYHPSASPGYGSYVTTVEMHTTGPNSLNMFWPLAGVYCHPILNGGSFTYFLDQEAGYTITGNAVSVANVSPTGSIVYDLGDNYNTRYDAATKTIYVQFGYNHGAGGAFVAASTREWTDTLIRTGPR
jgi:hypothetical protein